MAESNISGIFLVGKDFYHSLQVSTNGYFSLGTSPTYTTYNPFSRYSGYSIVAPFAADITTSSTGSVRYNTFTTGDYNIKRVSSFIRSELGGSFSGTWMVAADWNYVPLYYGSRVSITYTYSNLVLLRVQ